MPRIARIVIPGRPHHVTQRGNNRQDVFFVGEDREVYQAMLREEARQFGLAIDAYCLMTNHVHLIATPREEQSLARAVGRMHWRYSQTINARHGRSGHLCQNRFNSCVLQGEHVRRAFAYVERNPVRAGMSARAEAYPYSSARAHVEGSDPSALLSWTWFRRVVPPEEPWRDTLMRPEDEAHLEAIRLHLNRGRPLADDSFLSKLETQLNRRLRPRPVGRPIKKKADKPATEKRQK